MDYAVTLSFVIPTLQVKWDRVVELQTNLGGVYRRKPRHQGTISLTLLRALKHALTP